MTDREPGVVVRPTLKLEDVREEMAGHECSGRGRACAAPRGYNAELLPNALLGEYPLFTKWTPGPWADNYTSTPSGLGCYIEVKTAIEQYPSGGRGRFRIWRDNHYRLLAYADVREQTHCLFLYMFLVYTVESGTEHEIGKVIVPAAQVDEQIDHWTETNHVTMGDTAMHTVSWAVLLQSLGISIETFRDQDTVDATVGSASLRQARQHLDS